MTLHALGGGELSGDKFVRFVYLDESGRGDPAHEPFIFVAGVIVNADKQLKAVEKKLDALVKKYVPLNKQEGFCFHAKVLANGGGDIFDRKTYPEKRRLQALEDICSIPAKFKLPIVIHGMDRARALREGNGSVSVAGITTAFQTSCAISCLLGVEKYMREKAGKREVATLVYENTDEAKRHIRDIHNHLRKMKKPLETDVRDWNAYSPLERIAETAFFAEKTESSVLQIADAVAFIMNRTLRGVPATERFVSKIAPALILR